MRMQNLLLFALAAVALIIFFKYREGFKWDRGFAGFRPEVSGVITEGNLEIEGNAMEDVSVKALMIKKIIDATTETIFNTKGLKMFPIETVFVQVFNTAEKVAELKQKRPDVYDAYVNFLKERDAISSGTRGGDGYEQERQSRTALVNYLEQLKRNEDYASVPDNIPATYRARFLMLETDRFYGTEVDVIAIGDEQGIKIQGITSQPLNNGGKIKAFQDVLKAGEWMPYNTIANASIPNKSALTLAENAIKEKWGDGDDGRYVETIDQMVAAEYNPDYGLDQ
jgi:hypothetical protein